MGTDGRRSNRLAAEAGRLVDEARVLARGSGRLTVLGALSRVRAKVSGHEPSLRWVPSDLAPRYDVIVVGATLPGLFLAHELAERLVARVGLLEGERVGADWPSRPLATLGVVRRHPALSALVMRSKACYERLATAQAFALGFGQVDVVTLARGEADLARLAARLPARSARVSDGPRIVGFAEAAQAVPHLAGGGVGGGGGALLEPDVTTVRVNALPWQLASRAAGAGVAVVEGCRLLDASRSGEAWSLSTTLGPTAAPLVVDATAGADVLAAAGLGHHSLWRRWETLTTDPVQPFLRTQLVAAGVELRQTPQGELQIDGPAGPAPPGPTGAWLTAASSMASTAVEAVPLVAQLRLAARAWRSDLVPADGLPVVGPVSGPDGGEGLYRLGGLGSDPLALAPAAAEALARHLVDEEPMVPLRAFEPGRLRTAGARSRAAATAR